VLALVAREQSGLLIPSLLRRFLSWFLGLFFGLGNHPARGKQLNHFLVKPVEDIVYLPVGDSDSNCKGLALVFSFDG
jgi:hypothetical protein